MLIGKLTLFYTYAAHSPELISVWRTQIYCRVLTALEIKSYQKFRQILLMMMVNIHRVEVAMGKWTGLKE